MNHCPVWRKERRERDASMTGRRKEKQEGEEREVGMIDGEKDQ